MGDTLAIDFGTSNSAAGAMLDGVPNAVEIEPGQTTLPTSVFFDFSTNNTLFGTPANRALIEGREGRYMRSLKSVLGTSLMHEKRWIMGQEMTFVDIVGRFLNELKTRSEVSLGRVFDHALSGRPVHFHSDDGRRDRQALQDLQLCYNRAGFTSVEFMLEPEAAARNHGGESLGNGVGLIVDIGGGTSDFTLFRPAKAGIDVIASHGVRVGGTNFDRSLSIDHVMPLFGRGGRIGREMGPGDFAAPNWVFNELATWQNIPFLYSGKTKQEVAHLTRLAVEKKPMQRLASILENELGHDVAFAVEHGKITANRGDTDRAAIRLDVVEAGLNAMIGRADLSNSLSGHAEKIRLSALETLGLSNLQNDDVERVIFVGGSSLMSVVEHAMAGLFPNATMEYGDAFTAIIDGLTTATAD